MTCRSVPHSRVMCTAGKVITECSEGPRSRRSQLADQKCSMNSAASSDGAHRWRSKTVSVPEGYTSLTPFLVVDGEIKAIEFYASVFGADLVELMEGPDSIVVHAELDFGNGRLQLSDPQPAYQLAAVEASESVTDSVVLYCPDVDAVEARAERAGAGVREPVQTFVTGDRLASSLDPFGQRWAVMTRVEELGAAERGRRLAGWAEENGT
jgi:PhnB protein